MKKHIARAIFKIIKIFTLFPAKYIVFESNPICTDNTYSVYEYMKSNRLLKQYKFIWYSNDKIKTFKDEVVYLYILCRSRAIIYCNHQFQKNRKNQITINLCHGSKSKKTRGLYEAPKDLDYILVQAEVFKDSLKYEYNLSEHTEMITLGYPRNDDLLLQNDIDRNRLFEREFKKLIIWYPTFRQHKNKRKVSDIALPILHDSLIAEKINECAKKNKTLVVLKPHFAQDISYIRNTDLSNIIIIDDDFLKKNNVRSYQLLSLSDALLTDYSSVYYDYLLTDKPIGLVWEDYDEYKKNQGFALEPDIIYSGGEKIFNADDLCSFIERISSDEDVLKKEREKIKNMTNVYQDANSAQRVCEFIVSKIV